MKTRFDLKRTVTAALRTLAFAVAFGAFFGVVEYALFSFVKPDVRTGWSFYLGSNDLVYGVRGAWQLVAYKAFAFGWVVPLFAFLAIIVTAPLYPLYRRLDLRATVIGPALAAAVVTVIEFFVLLTFYIEPPGRLAPFLLYGFPPAVLFSALAYYLAFQTRAVSRLVKTKSFNVGVAALFAVITVLSFLPPPRPGEIPSGPNVIYITSDALRADRVGPSAAGVTLTPNIDAFAKDATTFERCTAPAPWTLPSFATVFTGVSPHVHRAGKEYPLGSQYETLAELFSRKGYDTAAVVANGLCEPRFGLAQGFHYYRSMEMIDRAVGSRLYYTRLLGPFLTRKQLYFDTTPVVERRAVKFLRSRKGNRRPFFLWVHILDPHEPYSPPAQFIPDDLKKYAPRLNLDQPTAKDKLAAARLYDGEVRFADEAVGNILKAAKEAGVYENAVVILSADHGEEFWEHGSQAHGNNLYDVVLRIPFVARVPGVWSPGSVARTPISSADLFGTLVELASLAPRMPHQSGSFLRWNADPESVPLYLYASEPVEGDEDSVAVYHNDHKFIYLPHTNSYEYYDLRMDAGERAPQINDVAAAGYATIIKGWEEDNERLAAMYGKDLGSDEMVSSQLRALGYIK